MKHPCLCLSLLTLCLSGCGTSPASSTAKTSDAKVTYEQPNASVAETTPAAESARKPAEESAPADAIKLSIVDYDGILRQIAQQKGKVVVMDAWSTSCPPCMKEFHNLVDLHKKYGADRVACLSLSFDYEGLGTPEEVEPRVLKFLRSQGATFDNLLSNEESDVLYRKFKLAAVPAVFVYDQTGALRKRFDNEQSKSAETAFTYAQVGQLVEELLQSQPTAEENAAAQP